MTFRQLIWHNVKRSGRTYGSYFLSALFSIFVFFIFAVLFFHPQLSGILPSNSDMVSFLAKFGLVAAQVAIVILSLIFLGYSFLNFLKARSRDLAIYLMIGIDPKDLRRMLVCENLLVGTGAVFSGVILGTLFSKFFLLITSHLMHLTNGLNFYFPLKPIALTIVLFMLIFVSLTFFMTRRIKTDSLVSLSKTEITARNVPKPKLFLSVLGLVVLAAGYYCLKIFVGNNFTSTLTAMALILGCVVLTIIGTFLILHQASIYVLTWAKRRPKNQLGARLLNISELILQMSENATMYGLIALTTTVAFVGIGITSLLVLYNQSSSSAPAAAFIFSSIDDSRAGNTQRLEKITTDLSEKISQAGYTPHAATMTFTVGPDFEVKKVGSKKLAAFYLNSYISESNYNTLRTLELDLPPLTIADDEIYSFANGLREVDTLQSLTKNERSVTISLPLSGKKETFTIQQMPVMFNAQVYGLGVVSDATYQAMVADATAAIKKEAADSDSDIYAATHDIYMVNYDAWNKDGALSDQLEKYLIATGKTDTWQPEDETYDAKYNNTELNYSSQYALWHTTRQAHGLLFMIGILLGAVFFIFAATILTFRLFGQMTTAVSYHRSLDLLGVSEKMRHTIITRQLVLMYFLPGVIACVHFAVAFWGVVALGAGALQPWPTYGKLIAVYFVFQFIFFLISRALYLRQLDAQVEKIGR